MPNHASITIVGHIGKDPVKEMKGEHTTTRFSVAVSRKRKAGDLTTWWNVTAWRKDAEYAANYLKKGEAVLVTGEPYLDEWTDSAGQKRSMLKIEATRVSSLGGRLATPEAKADGAPAAQPIPRPVAAATAATDDFEPPF